MEKPFPASDRGTPILSGHLSRGLHDQDRFVVKCLAWAPVLRSPIAFAEAHPQAVLVLSHRSLDDEQRSAAILALPYRSGETVLWQGSNTDRTPGVRRIPAWTQITTWAPISMTRFGGNLR